MYNITFVALWKAINNIKKRVLYLRIFTIHGGSWNVSPADNGADCII